jgi:hypothetical protein
MTRGLVMRSLGSQKGLGWTGFAAAVVACLLVLPGSARACGPQVTRDGFVPLATVPSPKAVPGMAKTAPASTSDHDSASIVGLWYVVFVSGGQVFDVGYDQWHSDGTEVLNDTAPPQPANGAGTVCLGVYTQTEAGTIKLKHPFWSFDANGNFAGSGRFSETITLDSEGNSYHGSFVFTAYDVSGNIIFQATGTLTGKRMKP